MHMQCVFLHVMYVLCLNRQYAAFTSLFKQLILCTCRPQRVGHCAFDMTVGNKLRQIRGPIYLNSIVSGVRVQVGMSVWWLSVRCGQFAIPLSSRVSRHKFHTFFCRPRASLETTNSFSNATNESSTRRAAFNMPPAAHIGTSN